MEMPDVVNVDKNNYEPFVEWLRRLSDNDIIFRILKAKDAEIAELKAMLEARGYDKL